MAKLYVYEMVTNRIIEKLEGVTPWRKPWTYTDAVNWVTGKQHRGINTMILEPGEYATFKQIMDAGGKIKKAKPFIKVVFWKWLEKEDEETEEVKNLVQFKFIVI